MSDRLEEIREWVDNLLRIRLGISSIELVLTDTVAADLSWIVVEVDRLRRDLSKANAEIERLNDRLAIAEAKSSGEPVPYAEFRKEQPVDLVATDPLFAAIDQLGDTECKAWRDDTSQEHP